MYKYIEKNGRIYIFYDGEVEEENVFLKKDLEDIVGIYGMEILKLENIEQEYNEFISSVLNCTTNKKTQPSQKLLEFKNKYIV